MPEKTKRQRHMVFTSHPGASGTRPCPPEFTYNKAAGYYSQEPPPDAARLAEPLGWSFGV